jgi:hypothetical protein
MEELRRGSSEAAWDLFLAQYRRVIFAAIYHYARDPDDAMDVFAWVTEALRSTTFTVSAVTPTSPPTARARRRGSLRLCTISPLTGSVTAMDDDVSPPSLTRFPHFGAGSFRRSTSSNGRMSKRTSAFGRASRLS